MRIEAAERTDREKPVVAGVRDDDRDLVDVPDDREERAACRARDAHPRRAEHVGVHLAEGAGLLAPHLGGERFLAGRAGCGEQAHETVGNGHGGHCNPARAVYG